MRSVFATVVLTVAIVVVAGTVVRERQLTAEQARVAERMLVAENTRAGRDSTRDVALEHERVAASR